MTVTLTMVVVCTVASYLAGVLDSIAGGGGLITLPAMLLAGVPPHATLGTGKFASSLGTSVSLANYARNNLVVWRTAPLGIASSLIGSWIGSLCAIYLDPAVLGKVMVMLLPVGMLVTLIPKKEQTGPHIALEGTAYWLALGIVGFLVGGYDGFFGPGAGSFFILAMHWVLRMGLIEASATSKVFNLASNVGALIPFMWHNEVSYMLGTPMAVASMAGHWSGSKIAIKSGAEVVRKFLFVSLSLLLATLVYQYFFMQ